MATLVLGLDEVRQIVHRAGIHNVVDRLVERLHGAFESLDSKRVIVPARKGFDYEFPLPGMVEWMPLMHRGKSILLKTVGYHPHNPAQGNLPTVLSSLTRYDAATGGLVALVDGTFLTVLRTAAASVVASRLLAAPQSSTLGLIGCGAQAVSQAHVLCRAFPIKEIEFVDTDAAAVASFASRMAPLLGSHVLLRSASLAEVVSRADILCTATSIGVGQGPLFDQLPHQAHLHINAIGSDFPGKTELPLELLEQAYVCPDFPCQAVSEGECQQLEPNQIGLDLPTLAAEVARGGVEAGHLHERLTVFDSTGFALEDDVVMTLFLELAEKFQIGQVKVIESHSTDPKDPYQFLWSRRGAQGAKNHVVQETER